MNKGFDCTNCGKNHPFTPYVFAHWGAALIHCCDCGALHTIQRGIATRVPVKKGKKK